MCGICGILFSETITDEQAEELQMEFYKCSRNIKHRGPDRTVHVELNKPVNVSMIFHRLSIMDLSTRGDQPFKYEVDGTNRTIYVTCNGEIYKFKNIVGEEELKLTSGSDCEVIIQMYKKYGIGGVEEMCKRFNSEHAFSILDVDTKTGDYKLILSSDRYGKRPLFVKTDSKGFYYSSELQGLPNIKCHEGIVDRFPAAHYGIIEKKDGKLGTMKYHPYYYVKPEKDAVICSNKEVAKKNIYEILTDAVVCRLEADRPIGCLLSGGLDSSLVSAIAAKHLRQFGRKLKTYSIGIKDTDSLDRPYAEMVAKYIDSEHTCIEFTESEFLNAIPDVIKTTGTYDITSVRATAGQYLISKWISENTDIKVLFCGDLSDEQFGGYSYEKLAPTPEDFHADCVRLIEDVHYFDGLRADRAVSYHGIELRLPFGDHRLIDYVFRLDPKLCMPSYNKGIEKFILRDAFSESKLLPEEVLWRSKEAFSNALSGKERTWIDIIKEKTDIMYTDEELKEGQINYECHLPPPTKEALYFREVFCRKYGYNVSVARTIPYYWLPKWCGDISEPSAHVLPTYKECIYKQD